jgi:hypothetical protein
MSIIFYLQTSAGFDGIDVEADNSNGDLLASQHSLRWGRCSLLNKELSGVKTRSTFTTTKWLKELSFKNQRRKQANI